MNLSTIEKEAINKINSVKDLDELEKNRLFYLGKKGIISQEMKKLSNLSIKEKKDLGKKLNEIKKSILINIDKQKNIIEAKEINKKILQEKIDLSLPSRLNEVGKIPW